MTPALRVLAAVSVGGAVGAVVRYLLGEAFAYDGGFPWTIFAINVVGSFLLALLPAFGGIRRSAGWTAALGPGVLGGFTTLSTFSEQTRALLDGGSGGTALAYVAGTLAAALLAVTAADTVSTRAARAAVAAEGGDE